MQPASRVFGRAILCRIALVVLLLAIALTSSATTGSVVNPSSLNFGNQISGAASGAQSVTLTNIGNHRISVTAIYATAPFSVSAVNLPVSLDWNQSLTVWVTFTPGAAQAYSGQLNFTLSSGTVKTAVLSGTGLIVAPSITTQPASQTVIAGQTATFSVAATGTAPLAYQWTRNGAAIAGATSFSYTTPAATLADNGAQFSVAVSNAAGTATSTAASLNVNPPPTYLLSANPTNLAFGTVNVGSTRHLQTILTNSGNSNVSISNVSIAGSGFAATGISSGQTLAPGQTATLMMSFSPASAATVTGSVTITSNATNSPAVVSVAGTGVQVLSRQVSLSWIASTSAVSGYNIYNSRTSGGPYAKLTASPVSTSAYTDTNVQSGSTYYYVVTAVNSNNVESGYSNEVSATIP